MVTKISAQALKRLMDSDTLYTVLDVRDWGEFTLEQIPGTNPLPRGRLDLQIEQEAPDKNTMVERSRSRGTHEP